MMRDKTALITGGSRGIGAAIACKLAAEGADIAIVYAGNRDAAEDITEQCTALGVTARNYQCDVSDFDAVKELVSVVKEDFGTFQILVNCAGINRDGLILNMKEEDFDSVVGVNLKGTFNMIRHCGPLFLRAREGCIINISSVAGLIGNAGQSNYAAAKAGIVGLTKSVARELASRGITCNAVAPGFIQTDMTAGFDENNSLVSQIPLGRMGTPEEVADLVAFLCTATYITGEVIRIDGGIAM
ncbi:MAG: 3-oxoacyl-[acyl-carrier-protein] reductase [Oscillospiraceae bacterium]|nr:3-oxoacyl-[acyl-carrier-protein] reductase [Oscillospiraceae bacterium]